MGPWAVRIVDVLGAGTFGVVCVLQREEDGALLAAKVLRRGAPSAREAADRLRDEARLLYRLRHPHLVRGEGLMELGDRPVVLMEYVRGVDLWALLHMLDGVPATVSASWIAAAARALDHAWSWPPEQPMRMVHRDLKPNNLLVSEEGTLKLLDLGTAKGEFAGREAHTVDVVLGTRGYMAPERRAGVTAHPSLDVYALGVVLFQLITARLPMISHQPRKHEESVREQRAYLRARLEKDGVPQPAILDQLVADMLAVDPDDRPTHAQVDERVRRWLLDVGEPDLKAFGRTHIAPLVRAPVVPRNHEAWGDIAMLEAPWSVAPVERDASAMPVSRLAPSSKKADDLLRERLAQPGWEADPDGLSRLLAAHPGWTDGPFLELLVPLTGNLFQRWTMSAPSKAVVLAALTRIGERPSRRGLLAVERLCGHVDAELAAAAAKAAGRY